MPSKAGFGLVFNSAAEQYDRMRPHYPSELYTELIEYAKLNEKSDVLEIGIGSGQASLPILKTGCKLTAVEPGEIFADICRKRFADYPRFSIINARFEDSPIKSASFDVVYAATSFHWIPEEAAYKKVYEILKPGGTFARFRNHPFRDRSRPELSEAIDGLYHKYMPKSAADNEFDEKAASDLAIKAELYGFKETKFRLYHRTRSFSAKEYTALLGTYSDHIALPEAVRMSFFAEVETEIERFGGEITVFDTIDMELARK